MLIVATEYAADGSTSVVGIDTCEVTDVAKASKPDSSVVTLCSGRKLFIDVPFTQMEAAVLAQQNHDEHLAKMQGYGDRPPKDIKGD